MWRMYDAGPSGPAAGCHCWSSVRASFPCQLVKQHHRRHYHTPVNQDDQPPAVQGTCPSRDQPGGQWGPFFSRSCSPRSQSVPRDLVTMRWACDVHVCHAVVPRHLASDGELRRQTLTRTHRRFLDLLWIRFFLHNHLSVSLLCSNVCFLVTQVVESSTINTQGGSIAVKFRASLWLVVDSHVIRSGGLGVGGHSVSIFLCRNVKLQYTITAATVALLIGFCCKRLVERHEY